MGIDVHVRDLADAYLRDAQAEAARIGTAARRRADALAVAADRSLAAARAEAAAMVERARAVLAVAEDDAARLRAEAEAHLAGVREHARTAQPAGSTSGEVTAATTAR
jgi:colicin import membrane protein